MVHFSSRLGGVPARRKIYHLHQLCNASITAFGARIIKSWGFDSLTTIALLIPAGFATCVTLWFFCYFADKYPSSRTYILILSCIPVWLGAVVIWAAPANPRAGPLIGFYLVAVGITPHPPLTLTPPSIGRVKSPR